MNLFRFLPGYESAIYDTGREPAFVMLLAFVVTYIITRGYTRIARHTGWGSASFGGVHTHHMVFGMVIAFVAGALEFSLLPEPGPWLLLLAVAFGVGVSLVLDEFALFFHLEDVYWEKEGRKSVDAVVLAVAFGSLFLMRIAPLNLDSQTDVGAWALFVVVCINLSFVLIAAVKGKIYLALFGLFIPSIAEVAAIRLAEPDSVWARKFYATRPKKLARSKRRYARYERKWRTRKERMWDIIGGKIGRPPAKV